MKSWICLLFLLSLTLAPSYSAEAGAEKLETSSGAEGSHGSKTQTLKIGKRNPISITLKVTPSHPHAKSHHKAHAAHSGPRVALDDDMEMGKVQAQQSPDQLREAERQLEEQDLQTLFAAPDSSKLDMEGEADPFYRFKKTDAKQAPPNTFKRDNFIVDMNQRTAKKNQFYSPNNVMAHSQNPQHDLLYHYEKNFWNDHSHGEHGGVSKHNNVDYPNEGRWGNQGWQHHMTQARRNYQHTTPYTTGIDYEDDSEDIFGKPHRDIDFSTAYPPAPHYHHGSAHHVHRGHGHGLHTHHVHRPHHHLARDAHVYLDDYDRELSHEYVHGHPRYGSHHHHRVPRHLHYENEFADYEDEVGPYNHGPSHYDEHEYVHHSTPVSEHEGNFYEPAYEYDRHHEVDHVQQHAEVPHGGDMLKDAPYHVESGAAHPKYEIIKQEHEGLADTFHPTVSFASEAQHECLVHNTDYASCIQYRTCTGCLSNPKCGWCRGFCLPKEGDSRSACGVCGPEVFALTRAKCGWIEGSEEEEEEEEEEEPPEPVLFIKKGKIDLTQPMIQIKASDIVAAGSGGTEPAMTLDATPSATPQLKQKQPKKDPKEELQDQISGDLNKVADLLKHLKGKLPT